MRPEPKDGIIDWVRGRYAPTATCPEGWPFLILFSQDTPEQRQVAIDEFMAKHGATIIAREAIPHHKTPSVIYADLGDGKFCIASDP